MVCDHPGIGRYTGTQGDTFLSALLYFLLVMISHTDSFIFHFCCKPQLLGLCTLDYVTQGKLLKWNFCVDTALECINCVGETGGNSQEIF